MNVLLVSPQTPDTFWSFKHVLRFVSKKSTFPPLGLLTVAAMLPRAWQLKLVDLNVARLRDEVSGVSLDEEAASMIKFQRAYEANAKYFTAVDEMLLTLMRTLGGG